MPIEFGSIINSSFDETSIVLANAPNPIRNDYRPVDACS